MAGSNVGSVFDMAAHARKRAAAPTEEAAVVEATPPMPASSAKPKKATGKKNDPDWEGSFVFLRIDTKADAIRLLKRKRLNQDFSELCEMLLGEWVERNS